MGLAEQFADMLSSVFQLVLLLFHPVILIPAGIAGTILIIKNIRYKKSSYYQITKTPFLSVYRDTGRYGEYLTYKHLMHLEAEGAKFLFNVYIPKADGTTSEIDVMMICSQGIFVFESKNYSGWIFGSENSKNWYQTLPSGRGKSHKEPFYNPVMQNRSHITHLSAFLEEPIPTHSVIVFSDRCTLKNVQLKSHNISVIQRSDVAPVVAEICSHFSNAQLSENKISAIYNKLYPLTQVDDTVKTQHITNVVNRRYGGPVIQTQLPLTPSVCETPPPTAIIPEPTDSAEAAVITEDAKTPDFKAAPADITSIAPTVSQCPWCGGQLVLRTAAKGRNIGNQFYGCSHYPKCKYIKNIPDS